MTGLRPLLRALMKHEGRLFAPWVLIATFLTCSSVLVYPQVFSTPAERMALAATVGSNPALSLIFGPAKNLLTVDGFNAWRSLALGTLLTALGCVFAVIRASRGQEDSGQAELLASGVMARSTRLVAALLLAVGGAVMTGVVSSALAILCGGQWESCLLIGASFTASGIFGAGLGALAAQIGEDSRSANALAAGIIGTLFGLRGFASVLEAPSWVTWVNPMAWPVQTDPAQQMRWWPLSLSLVAALVLAIVAFAVQSKRDFGQGLLSARPGPSRGSMRSPAALLLRLNAGLCGAWLVAAVALGVAFGHLLTSALGLLNADPAVAKILAKGAVTPEQLLANFCATVVSLVGIVLSMGGVQIMRRLRQEEVEHRVEPILAANVSRIRLYSNTIALAFAYTALAMVVAGAWMAIAVSRANMPLGVDDVLLQAALTVVPMWVVVGVAAFVVGARPHVSVAAWAGVAVSFGLTLLGPSFGLPSWALGISPFWHVPPIASAHPHWSGYAWLVGVLAAFVSASIVGFRRRDIA